jgi:hypothetical protein
MNVRDFCNLKWSNYSVDIITFVREKSKNSKQENGPILVSVKPEAKDVISEWGFLQSSKIYLFFLIYELV